MSYTLNEGVVIVNSVSDVNATLGHSTTLLRRPSAFPRSASSGRSARMFHG